MKPLIGFLNKYLFYAHYQNIILEANRTPKFEKTHYFNGTKPTIESKLTFCFGIEL